MREKSWFLKLKEKIVYSLIWTVLFYPTDNLPDETNNEMLAENQIYSYRLINKGKPWSGLAVVYIHTKVIAAPWPQTLFSVGKLSLLSKTEAWTHLGLNSRLSSSSSSFQRSARREDRSRLSWPERCACEGRRQHLRHDGCWKCFPLSH